MEESFIDIEIDWLELNIKAWKLGLRKVRIETEDGQEEHHRLKGYFDEPSDLITSIGLDVDKFEILKGFRGYKYRMEYNGIKLLYEGSNPYAGITLILSGEGCQTYRDEVPGGLEKLLRSIVLNAEVSCSRMDVAIDLYNADYITVGMLGSCVSRGELKTRIKKSRMIMGFLNEDGRSLGSTLYHGEVTSEKQYRAYDKLAERKENGKPEDIFPGCKSWLRYEGQFRRRLAREILENALVDGRDARAVFLDTLFHDLSYRQKQGKDKQKARWKEHDWWERYRTEVYEKMTTLAGEVG